MKAILTLAAVMFVFLLVTCAAAPPATPRIEVVTRPGVPGVPLEWMAKKGELSVIQISTNYVKGAWVLRLKWRPNSQSDAPVLRALGVELNRAGSLPIRFENPTR